MLKKLTHSKFRKKWPLMIFILTGVVSTAWFLLRVIPKPSRAAYPCMRAAAPIMSSFVIWLMAVTSSALIFKKSAHFLRHAKYPLAISLLAISVAVATIVSMGNPGRASAAGIFATGEEFTPNDPSGTARGIFPGRVVWYWDPDATREGSTQKVNNDGIIDMDDDVFYLPKNNDEGVIDDMMEQVMLHLTDGGSVATAWDSVFRYHNRTVNGIIAGYTSGETVYIKTNNQGIGITLNMNADLSQDDGKVWNSFPPHMTATSPYAIRSVIKQLVDEAGILQENIYVGDPHNNFNNIYYDILREGYPDIHIIGVNGDDVTDCEAYGRTLSIKGTKDVVHYSDQTVITVGSDKLYKQLEDADYIVNIAALKSHIRGGVTMFCKSHFGSHTRSSASHLHPGLPSPDGSAENLGYGKYRVLTDIMGHEDLGGKTALYILDGLWGGPPHELDEPRKWDMAPFNGDWTSSIFASFDPVAIASVGFDFLRTEYSITTWGNEAYPNMLGVDDYLHQAADPSAWPEGVTYDPEDDGTPLGSLGTHEHWNNEADMQYTRNLGTGQGIELLMAHLQPYSVNIVMAQPALDIYPNPAGDLTTIRFDNAYRGEVTVKFHALSGQLVHSLVQQKASEHCEIPVGLDGFPQGIYLVSLEGGEFRFTERLLITK